MSTFSPFDLGDYSYLCAVQHPRRFPTTFRLNCTPPPPSPSFFYDSGAGNGKEGVPRCVSTCTVVFAQFTTAKTHRTFPHSWLFLRKNKMGGRGEDERFTKAKESVGLSYLLLCQTVACDALFIFLLYLSKTNNGFSSTSFLSERPPTTSAAS